MPHSAKDRLTDGFGSSNTKRKEICSFRSHGERIYDVSIGDRVDRRDCSNHTALRQCGELCSLHLC